MIAAYDSFLMGIPEPYSVWLLQKTKNKTKMYSGEEHFLEGKNTIYVTASRLFLYDITFKVTLFSILWLFKYLTDEWHPKVLMHKNLYNNLQQGCNGNAYL